MSGPTGGPSPTGARARIRTILEAVALVVALIGCAWLLFRSTLYTEESQRRGRPHARDEARLDEAIVVAVTGDVVRLSPDGGTSVLAVGQRLRADDSVRTAGGARTDLQIGSRSRLTVTESTQLTIREITEHLHRFKLTRGRIAVDYQADGARLLRIESADGSALAETQGARFGVLSTGSAVAIATETGAVRLTAQKKTVEVGAGMQASVSAGHPPSGAEPIPARLLLRLADAKPPSSAKEGLCAEVEGTAPPAAEVLVDGALAAISEDGRFRVRVPAAPDKTSVAVAIRDATGRESVRMVPCGKGSASAIRDFAIRWRRKGRR